MYNPEIYYLIKRDAGVDAGVRDNEGIIPFVEFIFGGIILILSAALILSIIYWCWTLLTPGQQLLELGIIIIGSNILLLGKFILDELTTRFYKKFDDLKEQNAELNKKIEELNIKINELDAKNAELNKERELILECMGL